MVLFEPEPDNSDVEPFAKCPSCAKSIKLEIVNDRVVTDARHCPACDAFIKKDEIDKAYDTHIKITRARRAAGEIISHDWLMITVFGLVFAQLLIGYFIGGKFKVLGYFAFALSMFILFGGYFKVHKWLDKFAYFLISEEEFVAAKKEVQRSRVMWVAATAGNLLLWLIYFKFL